MAVGQGRSSASVRRSTLYMYPDSAVASRSAQACRLRRLALLDGALRRGHSVHTILHALPIASVPRQLPTMVEEIIKIRVQMAAVSLSGTQRITQKLPRGFIRRYKR